MTMRCTDVAEQPESDHSCDGNTEERGSRKRSRHGPSVEQQRLCPQQRYVKRPKHPGMATFDGSLRELPVQKSKVARRNSSSSENSSVRTGFVDTYRGQHQLDNDSRSNSRNGSAERNPRPDQASETELSFVVDLRTVLPLWSRHEAVAGSIPDPSDDPDQNSICNIRIEAWQRIKTDAHVKKFWREAKNIYVNLLSTPSPLRTVPVSLTPPEPYDETVFNALDGLRFALVRRTHDFLEISQDPQEADSLRRLAAQFGSSIRKSREETTNFTQILREMPRPYLVETLDFIRRVRVCLENLSSKLPLLGKQSTWAQTNQEIHVWLHIFLGAGSDIGDDSCCDLPFDAEDFARWSSFRTAPVSELDEQLRDWHWRQHPPPPPVTGPQVDQLYDNIRLPLKDPVLFAMATWLCLGPRIAADFHHFCRVFKFLAWFGATF